jgi:leucyl aminopeptidase (aminopeptidase T)
MRRHLSEARALALALGLCWVTDIVSAQSGGSARPDLPALAHRIAITSAGIKPGDVVVVAGGKHTIPLMEAIAIEAQKAGGLTNIFLSSDSVTRAYYRDVPEKYLAQAPTFFGDWVRTIDVWIGLPGEEDFPSLLAGIPESRVAKAMEAGQQLNEVINRSGVRFVYVGYPSAGAAKASRMPYETLERQHWAGVGADYEAIAARGRALQALLDGAREVRVTAPGGTDVTFAVGDRSVLVNDGIVTEEDARGAVLLARFASLPGGEVLVAPPERSARGKVVVPRHRCKDTPLTDVSFDLDQGRVRNLRAAQGAECLKRDLDAFGEPAMVFGSFSLGLNPALQVIENGADFRPSVAAGLVTLGIGANEWLGGANKTQGGFQFPVIGATVVADGKVLVRDGRIVTSVATETN